LGCPWCISTRTKNREDRKKIQIYFEKEKRTAKIQSFSIKKYKQYFYSNFQTKGERGEVTIIITKQK